MQTVDDLREFFDDNSWRWPFHAMPALREQGLLLGNGTVLARMGRNRRGEDLLALPQDEERLMALLSAVCGRQISPRVMYHIGRASEQWRRGDKVLAQFELAFARFPRLRTSEDAFRLFLAENLLDQGITPRRLTWELGFDPDLLKYDPNEPRGPDGRWIKVGDGAPDQDASSARVSPGIAIAARGLSLLAPVSPEALEALAVFATRITFATALLGALLIPTPNPGGISEGDVPGLPGVRYRRDGQALDLDITATADDGRKVTVSCHRVDDSLYVDEHGRPIGRLLSSGLYLDADSVATALREKLAPDRKDEPGAEAKLALHPDEPKLCPDPEPDRPHGAKERALDYEDDVHARVNPQLPLERGLAVKLWNPATGAYVYFEDCFRDHGDVVDGDMKPGDFADAKGPGYEHLLRDNEYTNRGTMDQLFQQAYLQTGATRPRGASVKWYFAEEWAADYVRKNFEEDYGDIIIRYMPARKRR